MVAIRPCSDESFSGVHLEEWSINDDVARYYLGAINDIGELPDNLPGITDGICYKGDEAGKTYYITEESRRLLRELVGPVVYDGAKEEDSESFSLKEGGRGSVSIDDAEDIDTSILKTLPAPVLSGGKAGVGKFSDIPPVIDRDYDPTAWQVLDTSLPDNIRNWIRWRLQDRDNELFRSTDRRGIYYIAMDKEGLQRVENELLIVKDAAKGVKNGKKFVAAFNELINRVRHVRGEVERAERSNIWERFALPQGLGFAVGGAIVTLLLLVGKKIPEAAGRIMEAIKDLIDRWPRGPLPPSGLRWPLGKGGRAKGVNIGTNPRINLRPGWRPMTRELPLEKTFADEAVVLAPALLVGLAVKVYVAGTLVGSAADGAASTFVPAIEGAAAAAVGAALGVGIGFEDGYKEMVLDGLWGL